MARRIARASTVTPAPKTARSRNKKRSLDAYAQAQKLVPEKGIAKHRLGEDLDDEPRSKRRRGDSDDEGDGSGVEEPQQKRPTKRSIADRDDDVEYGSDSDGNEWTMGGIAEGDDDSDLDSDEAFGESDEDRFEGFTFRGSSGSKGKSKNKKKQAASSKPYRDVEMDLNEKEESEEDSGDSEDDEGLGLGDDAIDLAAMLDDHDNEDITDGKKGESEDSSESNDEEDEYASESESEEEDNNDIDEEAIARNRDRIEAMTASSQGKLLSRPSEIVTLDDFAEDAGLGFEQPSSKAKKKQLKIAAITAPLPKRQQDRLDREVASKKAKAELEKWLPGTKQIRRAEHLSFPLQHPDDQGITLGKEKFLPSTQSAPQNELEESIQRIMEESGLAAKGTAPDGSDVKNEESTLLKAEELAVKDVRIEEVMQRRAELRRARELLFREEIRAKRLAKIKSKNHRRVMRKQKEREREAMQALGDEEVVDAEDEERLDRRRAEARMSTKHKDSKWAKALKQTNRTAWDADAKNEAIDYARRNEELRRRIEGKHVLADCDIEVESDISDDDDNNEVTIRKLDALGTAEPALKGGLAGLKFMVDADERRRKANNDDVERLRRELAIADGDEDEENESEEEDLGRTIFAPVGKDVKKITPAHSRLEFEAPEGSDDERDEEVDTVDIVTEKPKPRTMTRTALKSDKKTVESVNEPGTTSWLRNPENSSKGKNANPWLKAPKVRGKEVEIKANVSLTLGENEGDAMAPGQVSSYSTPMRALPAPSVPDTDEALSDPVIQTNQISQTLQQRAFAGDDVEAAFIAEKEDLAASEDEKEISNHLPGWGSWTGDGLSRSIRKANQRAKHNPLFKTKVDGVRKADRKDVNLENVIISEKQDRKGKKYLASMLPHEFETKEQYERSRRVPMGPEWTTKEVHQKMTKPRVVVKKGVNIKPLERPLA